MPVDLPTLCAHCGREARSSLLILRCASGEAGAGHEHWGGGLDWVLEFPGGAAKVKEALESKHGGTAKSPRLEFQKAVVDHDV